MHRYDVSESQMNDSMQGGLDLDLLQDTDFYHMRQLMTEDINHELSFDIHHDIQQNVEWPCHTEYSPLSCKVEDSLIFEFPNPSPPVSHLQVRADAAMGAVPQTLTSSFPSRDLSAGCCTADVCSVGEKPARRGRKRLPETVSPNTCTTRNK